MNKAFPKIFAIGTDYIRDIFLDEVEITEKVDGSQFGFGKQNGELMMRSKGAVLYAENPAQMFKEGVEYIVSIKDKIPDNTFFYCEYLQKPKHNVLKYDRIPTNHLVLFAMCDDTGKFESSTDKLSEWATALGIDMVPVIFKGKIENPTQLFELIKKTSYLGGADMEGVVVKRYINWLMGDQPFPIMSGKYVSEGFKEVHSQNWGTENTVRGKFEVYKEGFRTPARWQKAVQHLQERGELQNSPKDIGNLIKEVHEDITNEEKENIKTYLWNEFKGDLLRTATAGLPEWYKKELANRSFENGQEMEGSRSDKTK